MKKSLNGVKVPHCKNTKNQSTISVDIPDFVKIPMIQHMGILCNPLVEKGDIVFVGQKIGKSKEDFSVPIHASCSGMVSDIIDYNCVNSAKCKAIIIETDKKQTLDPKIKVPTITSKDEFIEAIKQSGLVGLGGAGFPTHIKFAYKDIDNVNKLVINAAECEPYITADFRECMENSENIKIGIYAIQKYLNIKEVYIGIEDNKPEAIQKLREVFKGNNEIKIVKLKSLYPQGAEKSIIYATTGIVLTEGKLPADCGVIVSNISTVGFVGSYLTTGIPLVSKRITVDGDMVKNPKNLQVPIGMSIKSVLDYCEIGDDYGKILMGGPMMGITIFDITAPVIKNNNAIIILSKDLSQPLITTDCIHCGSCIEICPVNLMPVKLEKAYELKDTEMLKDLSVNLCMNCGCCTYICPAKRHLAQKNQLSKQLIKNKK